MKQQGPHGSIFKRRQFFISVIAYVRNISGFKDLYRIGIHQFDMEKIGVVNVHNGQMAYIVVMAMFKTNFCKLVHSICISRLSKIEPQQFSWRKASTVGNAKGHYNVSTQH